MHVGRVAHQDNLPEGAEVVAPSAVEIPGEMYTDSQGMQPHTPARAMTLEDIAQAQEEFVQAARNAVETVSGSVRDLRVAEVVRQDVTISDGKVDEFRVRLDVSFKYDK